jgi:hypothetical protein
MAMIEFLERLPLWLLAIALNAWLMGFVIVGLWIFRRHVLPLLQIDFNNAYYVAPLMQSSVLLYGLIAALTAVGAWTRYSDVSRVVSAEATAITTLWRDLGGYPEPLDDSMRDVLRGYTDQVINGAWPQLKRGQIPSEGVEWMDRLQSLLYTFEPVTEGQKILHGETLRAFNHLVEQRRQRLDAAQGGLPGVLWFVLLGGAAARPHARFVLLRGERAVPGLHVARPRGVALHGAARHLYTGHPVHGRDQHRSGFLSAHLRPAHDGVVSAGTRANGLKMTGAVVNRR